jgi:hypothetical protein
VQNNGSLYLHAFLTKSGSSPNPHQAGYKKQDVVKRTRCKLNIETNYDNKK